MNSTPPRPASEETAALNAELLTHALHEVASSYRELNYCLFKNRLRTPQFEWLSGERKWGEWSPEHRSLRLSPALLLRGWGALTEVLKHEMAHQFVDEVEGLPPGEGPHGVLFRTVCASRGIDARAQGEFASNGSGEGDIGEDSFDVKRRSTLQRIESLLGLAQSDNQHEAENAMAQARRLMLKYNLNESLSHRKSNYSYRHVGEPTGRRMAWQRVLGTILNEHFFVEVIIISVYRPREKKTGSILELCGSPANLEIAAYAHDFLERAAQNLWKSHKRKNQIKRDRDRQSYLYGVMLGFYAKLQAEESKNQAEGLIWVGDPELNNYFRARHPHIRRVAPRAQVRRGAIAAGKEAGGTIVLHRGVTEGEKGNAPRLLKGKGRL